MKTKFYLLVSILTLSFAAVGCSDNNSDDQGQQGAPGSLKISLMGETYRSSSRAAAALPNESTVTHYTVYVFNNSTGILEKVHDVSNSTLTTTIQGLPTGSAKKIAVVANAPAGLLNLDEGDYYSDLQAISVALSSLDPATMATTGFLMVGETASPVTLSTTTTTSVQVHVKRLAAKLIVGNVTMNLPGDSEYDMTDFTITGVSVQRGIMGTTIMGAAPTTPAFAGGIQSTTSTTEYAFLKDAKSITFTDTDAGRTQNVGAVYYVLPNAIADNCTMITFSATYEGTDYYLPVKINYIAISGDNAPDGSFIKSNYTYTLNLTLTQLGVGSTDPDEPLTVADLDVEVIISGWNTIIQNETW